MGFRFRVLGLVGSGDLEGVGPSFKVLQQGFILIVAVFILVFLSLLCVVFYEGVQRFRSFILMGSSTRGQG